MFIVTSMIIIYTVAISFFAASKVESSIKDIEEKNAQEVLKKVSMIVNTVYEDLDSFRQITLQKQKNELVSLTDTIWSIIQTKYIQSKPENAGTLLKKRANEFKLDLMKFYLNNKDKMSLPQLKKAIITYMNINRYHNGTGYFWANDFTPTMVIHPIIPELNGKYLGNYKDPNGVYLFNEMVKKVNDTGTGLVKYQWLNPKTKIIEDKISYVFKFEPFNWIIGTGEYYSVLKQRLQQEVFELVNKVRYADDNYFFVSDYNNKLLSHPYLQGKDYSNMRDVHGSLVLPPMVKIAREKGEGFYSYWWKKNKEKDIHSKKLTFSKNFADWKMVISTGVYIDDISEGVEKRKKELMLQLREVIKTTKIGKTGYLYIFNGKGEMLIHPNENLDGNKNFSKALNPTTGKFLFDDLVNASKTKQKSFFYKWDKPSDKGNYIYDKVSWVEFIPELDLYIGSSVYRDEFKESGIDIRNFVIKLAVIIFIISLIYSSMFFRNLLTPITKLSNLALKVSKGDYSARCTYTYSNDEVGVLANEFNQMIDTIENRTKELLEQKNTFETLFNDTSDGLSLIKNDRFIDCNRAVLKMLKYKTKRDFFKLKPHQISPEFQLDGQKSEEKAAKMIEECLRLGNHRFEWILTKSNGDNFWVEIVLTKIKINKKNVIHVVWRDIGDKKLLEEKIVKRSDELEESNDELEQTILNLKQIQNKLIESEKMASLGGLVAGVAHEINTPVGIGLTGITHLLEITENIKKEYELDNISQEEFELYLKSSKELASIININLKRTADLIRSFKQIAVDQTNESKREFNLNIYIKETLLSIQHITNKTNLNINVCCPDDLIINSYPGSFSQVITNLIINSIRHAYEEEQIGIIYIEAVKDNEILKLIYKDDGKGISTRNLPKIFEPFFTTNREHGGTGLGLNIIYNIITSTLDGSIICKSILNEGVIFEMSIPLSHDEKRKENLYQI